MNGLKIASRGYETTKLLTVSTICHLNKSVQFYINFIQFSINSLQFCINRLQFCINCFCINSQRINLIQSSFARICHCSHSLENYVFTFRNLVRKISQTYCFYYMKSFETLHTKQFKRLLDPLKQMKFSKSINPYNGNNKQTFCCVKMIVPASNKL